MTEDLEITIAPFDPEGPLGEPRECEWMTPARIAIWHELVSLTRPGVLIGRHRTWVEIVCVSLDRFRGREGEIGTPEGYDVVRKILSDFGFTTTVLENLMGPRPIPQKRPATGWAGHKRTPMRSRRRVSS